MKKQYSIVKTYDVTHLVNTIDAMLAEGWVLQGGVSAILEKVDMPPLRGYEVPHYMQAMYKETEETASAT